MRWEAAENQIGSPDVMEFDVLKVLEFHLLKVTVTAV